jgi:hypothetical protein
MKMLRKENDRSHVGRESERERTRERENERERERGREREVGSCCTTYFRMFDGCCEKSENGS